MHCRFVRSHLNAYADGALSKYRIAQIARHLAACPTCAAEWQEIQQISALAQTWRDVSVPETLQARIAARMASVAPSPALISPSYKETTPMSATVLAKTTLARLPVGKLRIVPPLAVGMALFGMVAYALFTLRQEHGFAQVQKAMQNIKTAQWTRKSISYPEHGHTIQTYRLLARMNPPALMYHIRDGEKDHVIESADELTNEQGMTTYVPQRHKLTQSTPPTTSPERWQRTVRGSILGMLFFHGGYSPLPGQMLKGWSGARVSRNGQAVDEFRREWQDRRYRLNDIVDVDPTTHRVVRTESRQFNAETGRLESEVVQENYRYDDPIPDAEFHLP